MAKNDMKDALSDLMGTTPKTPMKQRKDFASLPKKTTTVGFRVPFAERERLERFFNEKEGLKLSEGLKRAVYEYVRKHS